jgi:hypothetical protein
MVIKVVYKYLRSETYLKSKHLAHIYNRYEWALGQKEVGELEHQL